MFGSHARFALKIWLGFVAAAFVLLLLFALFHLVFDEHKIEAGVQPYYWADNFVFGGYGWALSVLLSLPSVLVIRVGTGLLPLHILENKTARLSSFLTISMLNNLLYFALTLVYWFFRDDLLTLNTYLYTLVFYTITFLLGCLPIVWLNERTADDYFTD